LRIAVYGAGAWGTALAIAWSAGHRVSLWSREADHLAAMNATRRNDAFLPGVPFPEPLVIEDDFCRAGSAAELVVIATPVAGLRPTLLSLRALRPDVPPVVWVCKGFEAGTGLLPHQVAEEVLGAFRGGALTGPSFAQEVAAGQPTAVTLACRDLALGETLARTLHTARFRIYAHDDVVGAEVGGAVKNALAIATGICDGLKLGLNARAALMTRGLAEMSRLGEALGGRRETFLGLTGVGDLLLTCTGDLSRNRRVGLALADGRGLEEILLSLGHVAEGVSTAREVTRLAGKLGVDMPICHAVAAVLDGELDAAEAVGQLLARSPKNEF
jgi:glycerol-3-phosphate dehydrogenase (NAD(P)+)